MLDDSWENDPDKWEAQPWISFTLREGSDVIHIVRRCPHCGRYITEGNLYSNWEGAVKLTEWMCKVHGEVDPFWIRGP